MWESPLRDEANRLRKEKYLNEAWGLSPLGRVVGAVDIVTNPAFNGQGTINDYAIMISPFAAAAAAAAARNGGLGPGQKIELRPQVARPTASRSEQPASRLARSTVLANANYAQGTYSEQFSNHPKARFRGKTIDNIADALKLGQLSPKDVPVEYIVRDGNTLILNTRSSQALERAGIPRSQWNPVNMTGDAKAEARLTEQLMRNLLTSQGTPTVTPNVGN
jgi:hypothetical protein